MILKSLYDYYRSHPELPRPGFENREFKFVIVIRENGDFVRLERLTSDLKKENGRFFQVPQSVKRSGKLAWQKSNLLWDHYGYVLGYHQPGKNAADEARKIGLSALQHRQFVASLKEFPPELQQSREVRAVAEFYRRGETQKVFAAPEWQDCAALIGCNLTFRLADQRELVCCRESVRDYVRSTVFSSGEDAVGRCLITGKRAPLCRLMDPVALPGAKPGTSLVSFQIYKGFDSYGKQHCFNAPMSREAAFGCVTALNSLLAKESENKLHIGNSSVLFWTEKPLRAFSLEKLLCAVVFVAAKPDEQAALRRTFDLFNDEKLPEEDLVARYCLLGIAPHTARISVRFWQTGPVAELLRNIVRHYRDLSLTDAPGFPPLNTVLAGIALGHSTENIPPFVAENTFEAIVSGGKYPESLLKYALQSTYRESKISPLRASILKAFIHRKYRKENQKQEEIAMNYSPTNRDTAYQCGALFAILVRAQEEANHTPVAPIKLGYYQRRNVFFENQNQFAEA